MHYFHSIILSFYSKVLFSVCVMQDALQALRTYRWRRVLLLADLRLFLRRQVPLQTYTRPTRPRQETMTALIVYAPNHRGTLTKDLQNRNETDNEVKRMRRCLRTLTMCVWEKTDGEYVIAECQTSGRHWKNKFTCCHQSQWGPHRNHQESLCSIWILKTCRWTSGF